MKKFFSLMAIVALSVTMVGCKDAAKPGDKPKEGDKPAATEPAKTPDAPKAP